MSILKTSLDRATLGKRVRATQGKYEATKPSAIRTPEKWECPFGQGRENGRWSDGVMERK